MTVRLGLSSMKIGASPSRLTAVPTLDQSSCGSGRCACAGRRPGLGGQHALRELEMAHLQREQQGRAAAVRARRWPACRGRSSSCPCRRAPTMVRDAGWKPEQDLVEIGVAGGHAGDGRCAGPAPRSGPGWAREVLQRRWCRWSAARQVEDLPLGLVDGRRHVLGHRVADLGDLAGHADQPPEQRVLLDDAGVVHRVGDRRRVGLQRDQEGRVADRVQEPERAARRSP